MKRLSFVLALVAFSASAHAADIVKDFDSLGGNEALLDKAKALNPEISVRVVQDRIVSRKNTFEFGPEYTNVLRGDSYNKSQTFGLNAHYHITPHWSVGAKYEYVTNKLSTEGQSMIDSGKVPDIDYAKSQYLALVNWYPIYGKMNLYDLGVAHFDLYLVGGVGQVQLASGSTSTYTAGGGIGFWMSNHVTTRLEMRYQTYEAKRWDTGAKMDLTVAGVQVGYIL